MYFWLRWVLAAARGLSLVWCAGCPWALSSVESCWTRSQTCVLYIGRRILNQPLNHQGSPRIFFLKSF